MKRYNFIFLLFLMIGKIKFGMENQLFQDEYTIVEYPCCVSIEDNEKKMYQVALKQGDWLGLTACRRETFKQALFDLKEQLYVDPGMTGEKGFFRFVSLSEGLVKVVENINEQKEIKLACQDEIFLARNELYKKTAQYNEVIFEKGAEILQKLSHMNCKYIQIGSKRFIAVAPIPYGSAGRFKTLEKRGYIICSYHNLKVIITCFDIVRLVHLVNLGWTLPQFQKLKRTFFHNSFSEN